MSGTKPKKGDRLVFTGAYAAEVTAGYPPGTVVKTHYNQEFREPYVTVRLDSEDGQPDRYADWPVCETSPAPQVGQ